MTGTAEAGIAAGASRAVTGIRTGAAKAAAEVTGNPLALGLLSAASGFVVGMIVPLSSVESRHLPGLVDRAKTLAFETVEQTRRNSMATAAEQIEIVGDAAIEAVVEQARKIGRAHV